MFALRNRSYFGVLNMLSNIQISKVPNDLIVNNCRKIHISRFANREDKKRMLASLPIKDEGVLGEKTKDIDSANISTVKFPDETTPDLIIGNTRFADIPICTIKVTKNNTLMAITNPLGKLICTRTCGAEGFKTSKKGTNIAAQATGISLGIKAKERGMKQIRVIVKGLGPGRMASVKGLQMSGMDIVSISDNTPTPTPGTRPRKPKRL